MASEVEEPRDVASHHDQIGLQLLGGGQKLLVEVDGRVMGDDRMACGRRDAPCLALHGGEKGQAFPRIPAGV